MLFLSSCFSPDTAEPLVMWCGKIKYHLTVYFLSNICAKNYQNWLMFVRVLVQQISDTFETQCSSFSLIFCRGSMQWTALAAFQRFIVRCSFTVMSYSVSQRSMTWGVHIYYLGQGLDIPLRKKRMRRCSSTYCLCIIQWFFSWCHLALDLIGLEVTVSRNCPSHLILSSANCIHAATAQSDILLVVAVRNWSSRTRRWWLARSISTVWLLRSMAENLTQVTSQSPSKPNHWKVVWAIDFVLIIALAYCFLGYASFLQAGCLSYHPTNSVKALKAL